MNALTPIAVANADVLRLLGATETGTALTAIARAIERDKSNVNRLLKSLQEANLVRVGGDGWMLADAGRAALAAISRAETPAIAAPAGFVDLFHAQIVPDAANARRDWDSEDAKADLDALAGSILSDGLLHPLIVGPGEFNDHVGVVFGGERYPWHALIGGERRWRAIRMLITRGDWSEQKPIPCRIRDDEGLDREYIALADNLQRRALNPLEEAKAFGKLRQRDVDTAEIAKRVGVTQRQVQMRLQLLELDEEDQERLTLSKDDPDYLSISAARHLLRGTTPLQEKPLYQLVNSEDPEDQAELQRRAGAATAQIATEQAVARQDAIELTARQLLILGELIDAAEARGKNHNVYGREVEIRFFPNAGQDKELGALIGHGLVGFSSQYPAKAFVTMAGRSVWERAKNPLRAADQHLQAAREAAIGPVELAALEAGDYATDWLNMPRPPKPIELTDADALILLELHHAAQAEGVDEWTGPEIAWDAPKDVLKALREAGHLFGGDAVQWKTRRYHARLTRDQSVKGAGLAALTARFGPLDSLNAIERALKPLREKVLGAEGKKALKGAYATAWLNGPFELSPTEKKRAEDEAREAAERQARVQAAADAEAVRVAAVASIEREALTGVPFGMDRTLQRLLADHPLPWRWDGDESSPELFDASEQRVPVYFGLRCGSFARVLLLAVNAAAGMATPAPLKEPSVEDPDDDDDDEDGDDIEAGDDQDEEV